MVKPRMKVLLKLRPCKERTVIEANIKKRVHRKASAVKQARLKEIDAFEFDGKDG